MKIRLIGQKNDSGIGTHYGEFAKALTAISGVNTRVELIDHTDNTAVQAAARASSDKDVNIALVCANMNGYFRGKNINWCVFESTRIPSAMFQTMQTHDLWIPSEWGCKIAIAQGINPQQIALVPEGVNSDLHHPYLIPQPDKFRFLLLGKYEQRKSIDESIEAFAMTYGNNPDIELVIKSDYFRNHIEKKQALEYKIASMRVNNIKLVWGLQSETELANLYRSSNVFLFPSKAEGWGLPLIEAAATGLPLITTFHSGQTEFLQHIRSSCVLLDYNLMPIDCAETKEFYPAEDGNHGKWAVTTVEEIAEGIKLAYTNYDSLRTQAVKNSAVIRTKYSWSASATSALDTLTRMKLM